MTERWRAWSVRGNEVEKPVVDFSGRWTNKLGAEITLKMEGHALSGTYRVQVGTAGRIEDFPLVGFANGDIVSFVVDWGRYGTMMAWVGQHADEPGGGERLEAMWHMTRNIAENTEARALWGAFLSGSDSLIRAPNA